MPANGTPVEFDCEGCGTHIYLFGASAVPKHGFCGLCAWLCEYITDPDEFYELYKHAQL